MNQKVTNSRDGLIYYIDGEHEIVKIHLAINSNDFKRKLNGEDVPDSDAVEIAAATRIKAKSISGDMDILIADHGCLLLRELHDGSRKLKMHEIAGLAKDLCLVSGAQTKIAGWMRNIAHYEPHQVKLFEHLMKRYKDIGYGNLPGGCNSFCPYQTSCHENRDVAIERVVDLFRQKQGTIKPLVRSGNLGRPVQDIRQEMTNSFAADLNASGKKVFVYKSFVGIGKTQLYLVKLREFIQKGQTVLIAFPTHKVKQDVYRRLHEHLCEELIERSFIDVPEIPQINSQFNDELNGYYNLGDYRRAKKFIEDYLAHLNENQIVDISDEERQLQEYFDITNGLQDQGYTKGKIILTTHERLLRLGHIQPDIVIVDEDITTSLVKQQTVPFSQVQQLEELIQNGNDNSRFDSLQVKLNTLLQAKVNILYKIDAVTDLSMKAILMDAIATRRDIFNSRIVDLLFNGVEFVKHVHKGESGESRTVVSFIVKRPFSFRCKTFVMSATADKDIYEQLLTKPKFREFDVPHLEAKISINHDYSYSRRRLRGDDIDFSAGIEYLESLREKGEVGLDNEPLIVTFQEFEAGFRDLGYDLVIHYGNVTGTNEYDGRHVVLVGTPNINSVAYALYANIIFRDEDRVSVIPKYKEQLVSNTGYRFYFWTSSENAAFRKIHMWMVESELVQALGRGRPIQNPCQIRLYTNYPPGDLDMKFVSDRP